MKVFAGIIMLLPFYFGTYAQDCRIPIQATFDSVPFVEFVKEVEETTGLQFFFKPAWVDTLRISSDENPATLQTILEKNFSETSLSYFIYNCSKIIIMNDYPIVEEIPESFVNAGKQLLEHTETGIWENSTEKLENTNDNQYNDDVLVIGNSAVRNEARNATLTGIIRNTNDNEPVIGATVYFKDLKSGAVTDSKGFYRISIETGTHEMQIRSVGKKEKNYHVVIYGDGTFNETLEDESLLLEEVNVYASKVNNIRDLNIGIEKIDIATVIQIPSSVGERDILKMALLIPGVQTVGEGSAGFNVRGGSTDQNLVLIDNSPVYNSSHLFGFFSTINADVVSEFDIYKSSYPACYGGRLSSILDVKLRKGDSQKPSLSGGISPVTSRLLFEGPIIKDRASFIVSARSTYSDWILNKVNSNMLQNSNASFYDLNAKISVDANKNNLIQMSGYFSHDFFRLNSDTSYAYENLNSSLLWGHSISDRFSFTVTGIYSKYRYAVGSHTDPRYAFDLFYDIRHLEGKIDLQYHLKSNHMIRIGADVIKYDLNPGTLKSASDVSFVAVQLDPEQGVESAVYYNDEYSLGNRLLLNLGFRYSFFYSLGPAKVYKYADGLPWNYETRIDSAFYERNLVTKKYGYPEFRLSARFQLTANSSVKASFTQMTQYIHMLTNTMVISPTDTWTLSNPNLKPQRSKQYSIGYYLNFLNNEIETSIEAYYKVSQNRLEFKPGARLLTNPDLELDLLSGSGLAYGIELMLKKKSGKLNGWFSYSYSRSLIKVDSEYPEERINGGRYFPAIYDMPNNLTFVVNYKFSRRISFSATITHNTGHPVTYPVAQYKFRGRELLHYSDRNEYRIPDYFRMDFSINIEGNLKIKKLAHSSWSFSIYNLTGRDNVYSVYFVSDPYSNIKGYKLSVFDRPIPSITYNFKF